VKESEPGGACSTHKEGVKCAQNLIWKPQRKTPTGKRMHRWKNNIKMELKGCGLESSGLV